MDIFVRRAGTAGYLFLSLNARCTLNEMRRHVRLMVDGQSKYDNVCITRVDGGHWTNFTYDSKLHGTATLHDAGFDRRVWLDVSVRGDTAT